MEDNSIAHLIITAFPGLVTAISGIVAVYLKYKVDLKKAEQQRDHIIKLFRAYTKDDKVLSEDELKEIEDLIR